MLDRLIAAADRISRAGVWAGGVLLLAAAMLIAVDILARKLIGVTLGGSDELSGYTLAMVSAWAFSFALLRRANIRVDALYRYTPKPVQAALDVLSLLALAAFAGIVAWFAWGVLADSWRFGSRANTPLQTPLWIPQAVWLAGLAFFLATLALVGLKAAILLAGGRWREVERLAGLPDTQREVDEEIEAVRARMSQVGRP